MRDDPDPVPPGTTGAGAAVRQQRTWSQVDVDWDDGRKLMVSSPFPAEVFPAEV
jgi:hypothetical protein